MTTTEHNDVTFGDIWAHCDVKDYGIYQLYDADDQLLYIGITRHLRTRLKQHFYDKGWMSRVTRVEFEHGYDRVEAEKHEASLIRECKPLFNKTGSPAKPSPSKNITISSNGNMQYRGIELRESENDGAWRSPRLTDYTLRKTDSRARQEIYAIVPRRDILSYGMTYADVEAILAQAGRHDLFQRIA